MQTVRNGYYWVWWKTTKGGMAWFLLRMINGHGHFVGQKDNKLTGAKMLSDDHHFLKLPDRDVTWPATATAEEILAAVEEPKHTPYYYTRFTYEKGKHESTVI
jgi:hypothetical protein